jgi:hypothetical protein
MSTVRAGLKRTASQVKVTSKETVAVSKTSQASKKRKVVESYVLSVLVEDVTQAMDAGMASRVPALTRLLLLWKRWKRTQWGSRGIKCSSQSLRSRIFERFATKRFELSSKGELPSRSSNLFWIRSTTLALCSQRVRSRQPRI